MKPVSKGLYPASPNLSKEKMEAPHAFWVIKHGIKASGMPAWGKSMSDEYVWNITAFLQKLPDFDEGRYKDMVARSGGHYHDHDHGGAYDEDADHDHDAGARKHAESSETHAEPTGSRTHTHADGKQHVHRPEGAKQ